MAKKLFGQTGNFPLKDFKDKKPLGQVEKKKPGINTAPSSMKNK